ncbi:nucleotide pyrophosphatase [Vibrio azureus]|uniref:Nucleotide pyrophosphatase n=1 Tax=Vibrio azureus NBRC 104587 TaxID=1219077 RepID=U3CFE3_9VIBR|nr:alkaline phosphatase family protein [Vibrio azureus]AUI88546.1 nucleotide pyrophosphatase [Vibrio azureus]GAD77018.1 hypothetical protein VAZ01S_058_00080 [Vibrio azureus NBRC 104587]
MSWSNHYVLPVVLSSLLTITTANASLGETPVIGTVFNSSEILKNQVASSLTYSTTFARDLSLFTIGGMTFEAYLATLPLEKETKLRVMSQIADPTYSIPLGYFLYHFYDRYTGLDDKDQFKAYLLETYDKKALTQFEHALFSLNEDHQLEEKKHAKDQAHQEGLVIDNEFIAAMVTVYDALFQIGQWQDTQQLPDHYTYLSQSQEDLELVAKIQPIVINIMQQAASGMADGDMKHAVEAIIEDNQPKNLSKPNNKAQALTITLIDFVRLNVLKGYRQFVYQDEKQQKLNQWLQTTFDEQPEKVLAFLQSQQNRRFGVQIVVDGLQQGLLEGLVDPSTPFLDQVNQRHEHFTHLYPPKSSTTPEQQQSVDFLKTLVSQNYDDPLYLPFFKQLYQDYKPSITRVGISSTPTISVRNLPIVKTGAKVSGHKGTGVPNFHFIDRNTDRAYYFFGNDALQLDKLLQENQVETMFDRLVHLKTLNCNAQYDWNAHTSYDGLVNLGVGESLRDFGEKRCLRELTQRAETEQKLSKIRQQLIQDIQGYQALSGWQFLTKLSRKWVIQQDLEKLAQLDGQGMPDYTLIYNPWPDHFAHFYGPFSDEVIMPSGELNRLDYWLRQIEGAYKKAGVYQQTLWGMAGDHGLTPVYHTLNPEKVIFKPLAEKLGYALNIKKISSDEGEGPKITNALNYPSNNDVDVIVASTAGGNFMMDLFNSRHGWEVQPIYSELINWQPINHTGKASVDIISETINDLDGTLDYLVVRETACDINQCSVRLSAKRNGKRHDEIISHKQGRYFYGNANKDSGETHLLEVQQLNPYLPQPNPRELDRFAALLQKCLHQAKREDTSTWCNGNEWRELTHFTPRPDSVIQLAKLYEEDRAGTINLFPVEGIGFNTMVPGRHAGESYLEKDAFLGFWGAPIGDNVTPLTSVANGSLAPTIFEYLTGESVKEGQNGWGFPSVLDQFDVSVQ